MWFWFAAVFDLALLCGIGLLLCLILHEDVVLFTVVFDLALLCGIGLLLCLILHEDVVLVCCCV